MSETGLETGSQLSPPSSSPSCWWWCVCFLTHLLLHLEGEEGDAEQWRHHAHTRHRA